MAASDLERHESRCRERPMEPGQRTHTGPLSSVAIELAEIERLEARRAALWADLNRRCARQRLGGSA